MRLGLSFLAGEIEQLEAVVRAKTSVVEAVIFNRKDLEQERWSQVWSTVHEAATIFSPSNVTFHFPVNDADYVSDPWVRERLVEAFLRSADLGLAGVVVHANRIRSIENWRHLNVENERLQVVDTLQKIASLTRGPWLALENMPIMDNHLKEIDPTFVFPEDFSVIAESDISIIWDICHYFNTIATVNEVKRGAIPRGVFPNLRECGDFLDFRKLSPKLTHWHFSAFQGIPNPLTGTTCTEGHTPWSGTLPELLYRRALLVMEEIAPRAACIFEVQENDYRTRKNGSEILNWSQRILTPQSNSRSEGF